MRGPTTKTRIKIRQKKFLTKFDHLPNETILEIFDYLSSNDIIYGFFSLNKRFQSLILQNPTYLTNFETPSGNFYFWENIFSLIGFEIKQLTITTTNFNFSLNFFSNIQSIIICSSFPIDYQHLIDLFENVQFNKLISFQIQCQLFNHSKSRQILIEKIFHQKNSLQIFECLADISFKLEQINLIPMNINIHTLTLKLFDSSFGFSLLKCTPNIKCLNLIINSFTINDNKSNQQIDFSEIRLKHFSLTFERLGIFYNVNSNGFLSYMKYIKQYLSSINSLSINLSRISILNNQFNGNILRQELLQSMIKLKEFHFYIKLEQEIDSIENIFSTFSSEYWFDHNWFIGNHGKYLYTLPFHFNEFYDFTSFNHIQSNNLIILNSSSIWYHIKSIHWQIIDKLNRNLIKQLKMKMPNLISITLNGFYSSKSDKIKDSILHKHKKHQINPTLNCVTTLQLTGYLTEIFQQQLINIFPNLKHLKLPYIPCFIPATYQTIESLKISYVNFSNSWITKNDHYFSNVKHIQIELDDYRPDYVMAVWEIFKNFQSLMLFFRSINDDYSKIKANQMINMLEKLNLIKILTTHQIKNQFNSIQFIKKLIMD